MKIAISTVVKVFKRQDVGEGNSEMKDIDDLGYLPKILAIIKEER